MTLNALKFKNGYVQLYGITNIPKMRKKKFILLMTVKEISLSKHDEDKPSPYWVGDAWFTPILYPGVW